MSRDFKTIVDRYFIFANDPKIAVLYSGVSSRDMPTALDVHGKGSDELVRLAIVEANTYDEAVVESLLELGYTLSHVEVTSGVVNIYSLDINSDLLAAKTYILNSDRENLEQFIIESLRDYFLDVLPLFSVESALKRGLEVAFREIDSHDFGAVVPKKHGKLVKFFAPSRYKKRLAEIASAEEDIALARRVAKVKADEHYHLHLNTHVQSR